MLDACNQVCTAFGLPIIEPPNIDDMKRADPSEAADSERIREALFSTFPNAEYIPMGGVIYHMALTGRPLELPDPILKRMLQIDAKLNEKGLHVYAHATAVKV